MRPSSKVESAPWITAEGTLDLAKFPIDAIVRQTLAPDFERFRSGCALLGSMAGGGRLEAGVYLVGLLPYYASDLQRLDVIAEQLQHFIHESSAHALFAEIRRVKSSNTTRRYLDRVLQSLSRFPAHLVDSGLQKLVDDTSFSPKLRAKFRHALERTERW